MHGKDLTQISVAFEECVLQYIAKRRDAILQFVGGHFSLQHTIAIQKQTFVRDVFVNPLNSLWSIPYLTLKKIIETLDKQGWRQFTGHFARVPTTIKTGYQKEIETVIANEFLNWNSDSSLEKNELLKIMHAHPVLRKVLFSDAEIMLPLNLEFQVVLENFSSSRASVADLAGSLLTVAAGWLYFGDKSLGILGIGDRIARRMAKDKAASQFFLGKGIGSSFYNLFPPQPTTSQFFLSTLTVGALLTVISLVASALSDPLRKKLGLQERKLNSLLEDLETELLVHYKRRLKIYFTAIES